MRFTFSCAHSYLQVSFLHTHVHTHVHTYTYTPESLYDHMNLTLQSWICCIFFRHTYIYKYWAFILFILSARMYVLNSSPNYHLSNEVLSIPIYQWFTWVGIFILCQNEQREICAKMCVSFETSLGLTVRKSFAVFKTWPQWNWFLF